MTITLELHCSSATLLAALRELKRQYDAMTARYPDMQMRGQISGAEAERRLFAQRVAIEAVGDLAQHVADEERAIDAFGPRADGEGGAK